ncbi:hypothetical protein QE152_g9061 [Popillia japonica]|uniref:Uncharacterized protein n=1 Tax=Popillia japonica TaxID=7064 RepID=A0AAW1LYX7_POPJA
MFANQEQIAHQASKNQNQINSLQAYYHRTLLLEELRQQVKELFDATTFAKAGILHPLVIAPDILLSSIKNLHLNILENVVLPSVSQTYPNNTFRNKNELWTAIENAWEELSEDQDIREPVKMRGRQVLQKS